MTAPTWTVSFTFSRLECGSVQMKPASTSLSCSTGKSALSAVLLMSLLLQAVHTATRCCGTPQPTRPNPASAASRWHQQCSLASHKAASKSFSLPSFCKLCTSSDSMRCPCNTCGSPADRNLRPRTAPLLKTRPMPIYANFRLSRALS